MLTYYACRMILKLSGAGFLKNLMAICEAAVCQESIQAVSIARR